VPSTLTPTTFADGGLGSGSLRDAVLQLNADTGTDDDIIQLQAGTYALTIQNVGGRHETAGLTGDLNLTSTSHRWIIQGAGSSGDHPTVIDASQLHDRVFQIVNPGTQVVVQDLIIQGGLAQDNGADGAQAGTTEALGGGILNNGGDVTLENVVVQNNGARGGDVAVRTVSGHNAFGGGIYSSGGALTLARATIANNQATGGRGDSAYTSYPSGDGGSASGAGLYASGGSLDISDSTVANNQATGGRGGDACPHAYGGDGGSASGAGLYASGGSLDISDSTVANNQATGGRSGDSLTTRTCTSGYCYTRYYYGGTGGAGRGGGLYVNGSALTIATSTIASNQGTGGPAGFNAYNGVGEAGGLYNGGTLTVSNSTLSGNSAGYGGGIDNSGTLTVSNSTLSANGNFYGGGGGGIYNQGTLTLRNTLLAGNSAGFGPDLAGRVTSQGHNLIGDGTRGSGFDPTDLVGTAQNPIDPTLGPLQDNGGPTQTMALLPGSPAIDAGDNAYATDWDQRGPGYPRIVNGIIDIGAFEVQAPAASRPSGQPLPDPLPVAVLSPPPPNMLVTDLWTSEAFGLSPASSPTGCNGFATAEMPPGASTASMKPWQPPTPGPMATTGNNRQATVAGGALVDALANEVDPFRVSFASAALSEA
jgi:hypothetical protein